MLILLEAISAQGPAAGPKELAQHTALPQATTYRLLGEMQRLGLIEREGTGYRMGNRLTRLAFGAIPEERIRQALDPGLKALADETGETSFAARLTSNGVDLFLRRLPDDGAAGGVLPPMGLRPAICSAAKAIVAYLPAADREGVIAGANLRFPDLSREADEGFRAEMDRIAESSFATCFGEEDPDIGSFATPIPMQGRNGAFSVGIVGPRTRIEANWLRRQRSLQEKAALMSRQLAGVALSSDSA